MTTHVPDEYGDLPMRSGVNADEIMNLVQADLVIARGHRYVASGHLRQILGRPSIRLTNALVDHSRMIQQMHTPSS